MVKNLLTLIVLVHLSGIASCSQVVGKRPQSVDDVFIPDGVGVKVEAWIENLTVPWSLLFLPDGRALVCERPGRIRLVRDGTLREEPYAELAVAAEGEGGLLGLALDPAYPREPSIYVMHTYREEGMTYNRVVRLRDEGDTGVMDGVILDAVPGGRFHNGGRIAFGPDKMLYITTGETFRAELAQDLSSLAGKILRITSGGEIPGDNPFRGSPVYSYGHRNPQGIAWHPETGDLFSSEHGPSGESGRFAHDEINVIVRGGNYGWPKVIGSGGLKSYRDPLVVWKETTPPSGITFYNGSLLPHLRGDLFVATLRSESLIRVRLSGKGGDYHVSAIERWFRNRDGGGRYGRIRDVVQGPDGALYFLTSNRDGRGSPRPGDDRIYRILPE